jgi:hypothetical protein
LQNDSLAKQVKGLKAKNNELIREHIEMVKDKNSFGIQLQNQKLDIKRLTTLQSIHTGKQFAPRIATSPRIATDVSTSKSQTDENFRPFFLTPKANLTESSYQTAVDRRMSSFFAINQLSDELAQVQVAERSINIENIDPGRSPKFQDALIISISSTSEKNANFERKLEQTRDEIRHSSICEVPLLVSVNGIETQKSRAKSQVSKTPRIGELTEKVPTKQSVVQTPHEIPQGNASRQRSQVNYKEASAFYCKMSGKCEHCC